MRHPAAHRICRALRQNSVVAALSEDTWSAGSVSFCVLELFLQHWELYPVYGFIYTIYHIYSMWGPVLLGSTSLYRGYTLFHKSLPAWPSFLFSLWKQFLGTLGGMCWQIDYWSRPNSFGNSSVLVLISKSVHHHLFTRAWLVPLWCFLLMAAQNEVCKQGSISSLQRMSAQRV